MAKGYFFGIGLEHVDPRYYQGWDGHLDGTIPDVRLFEKELLTRGYEIDLLLTENATISNVSQKFDNYIQKVQKGDILVIFYSGHGTYFEDDNGDEQDGRDEAWVLYDGEMLDDRIWEKLQQFPKGVRILMLSDSCYSGTVFKIAQFPQNWFSKRKTDLNCSLKFFGGSRDDQTSADLGTNGLFTKMFWESVNYLLQKYPKKQIPPSAVFKELKKRMPNDQIPTYFTEGSLNTKFNTQTIFKI